MFSRPEVAAQMRAEPGARPPGDLRYSGVWKEKLLDNPHMNGDCRNIGLTMFSDGVPWSDDRVHALRKRLWGVRACDALVRLPYMHMST
jgi:hypothetical protein